MRAGRLLEAAVARFWTEETGIATVPGSEADHIYADPERPYLRATPDRIYLVESGELRMENDGQAGNAADGGTAEGHSPFSTLNSQLEIGVLECKTTRKKVDPDALPPHWFCQLQWQMGIAGAKAGQIAWLTAGTDFGRAEVGFVPAFYDWMAERAERFWTECVIGGREPAPADGADAAAMFPRHTEGMLIGADEKAYGTYLELVELKERLSEMEAQKSELEGRLKLAIGQAEGLHWHNRTLATWKTAKDSEAFDAKAFRRDHPELAAKYTVAKPGARRFLLK